MPTASRSSARCSPQWDLDLAEPYQARLRRSLGDAEAERAVAAAPSEAMATLGEVLLTPTRIYARAHPRARGPRSRATGHDLHGLAHITGGGLPGNVPRALPDGLAARLDPARWPMPSVMRLFGALGGLDDDELRATFNGGLGMIVVVPPAAVGRRSTRSPAHGDRRRSLVGEVVEPRPRSATRYVEGPLEAIAEASPSSDAGRIAVGVSGAGSNLRALRPRPARGELGGDDRARLRRPAVPGARLGGGAGDRDGARPGRRRRDARGRR